jgi:sugar lactone lactonase YvrE
MSILKLLFSFLITVISLATFAQQTSSNELFKSSILTTVNSSTVGVEGPAVDKGGTVYYVNFEHQGTIGQISPEGAASIFIELPEGSIGNGIRFDSRGNMLIADYTNHNILKVDMATKKISVFAHESKMNQPNDIAIDTKDRLYASDPDWKKGTGRIWRIDTDGKFTILDSLGTANGIEVSPNEKTLYVNASRKLWAYDLSPKGDVSNKRLLIEFPDFGMEAKVSPEGKVIKEIPLVGKRPTNVAFGGKDGCTVFVTLQDQGNLESFRADIPGREWKMQRKIKH